jgi:hypothetical protein
MAITHDYTIICEFVRPEAGGKFTIIGLFPNGIGVPQIPFSLPALTFFSALRADEPGTFGFTATLRPLEGGPPLANANGRIQTAQAGPIPMQFPLLNLRFMAHGTYTWSIEIAGQPPFLTQFQVAIVPQQPFLAVPHPPRF